MSSSEVNLQSLQKQFDGQFFKLLFEQINDGVIITDKNGVVVFWSSSAEDLYGFTAAEMLGNHINKLGSGFNIEKFKQRLLDGQPSVSGEWSKEFPDGQQRTFRVTTTSLENGQGEFIGVLGLSEEITKEKMLQAGLEEAIVSAKETSKLKSAFLSSLSHEIKTPLAGIIGLADLIHSSTEDEDIQNYVQIQKESCERLLNTMRSILEMSKLDAHENRFTAKICNLNELVNELVQPYVVLSKKKALDFNYVKSSSKILALVDPIILTQIISNLLSNAIKYTPEGSISVSLDVTEDDPKSGCLTILDTGIGMESDFVARLFEPYTREERVEVHQNEGHGLGLNIAYQYIRMLGWDIEVASVKGNGSEFKVCFPLFDNQEVTSIDA